MECKTTLEQLKADVEMGQMSSLIQNVIFSVEAPLDGFGEGLLQMLKGQSLAKPVAFTSKTFGTSQKKYSFHRCEFIV